MTTQAATIERPRASAQRQLSFFGALRSEWIKLSTLQSTWWSIGITAILTIGISALFAAFAPIDKHTVLIGAVLTPVAFTMLVAGILGAISVSGEYSTGMIRSTLAAIPIRGMVLAAKAIAVALILFVSSLVTFIIAAIAVSGIGGARGGRMELFSLDETILPILGGSLTMAVYALIGVAFGFLLRSGAGAIAATVGLLFILPIVLNILMSIGGKSLQWIADVAAHLPAAAGQSATTPTEGISQGSAYLTLGLWVVGAMLVAWVTLRKRDA